MGKTPLKHRDKLLEPPGGSDGLALKAATKSIRRCSADFCHNNSGTHKLVLIPGVDRNLRNRDSESNKKRTRVARKDDCRRVQLQILWHNSKLAEIDEAILDGRRLQVCTEHYPPGSINEKDRGYISLNLDAVPYTFDELQELRKRRDGQGETTAERLRRTGRNEYTANTKDDVVARLHETEEKLALAQEDVANAMEEAERTRRKLHLIEMGERSMREQLDMYQDQLAKLKEGMVQKASMDWVLERKERVQQFTGFQSAQALQNFIWQCYEADIHKQWDNREPDLPRDYPGAPQGNLLEPPPRPKGPRKPGPRPALCFQDALCMALTQYRRNFSFYFLAHLFGISDTTCNADFKKMTTMLQEVVDEPVSTAQLPSFSRENFAKWKKTGGQPPLPPPPLPQPQQVVTLPLQAHHLPPPPHQLQALAPPPHLPHAPPHPHHHPHTLAL